MTAYKAVWVNSGRETQISNILLLFWQFNDDNFPRERINGKDQAPATWRCNWVLQRFMRLYSAAANAVVANLS